MRLKEQQYARYESIKFSKYFQYIKLFILALRERFPINCWLSNAQTQCTPCRSKRWRNFPMSHLFKDLPNQEIAVRSYAQHPSNTAKLMQHLQQSFPNKSSIEEAHDVSRRNEACLQMQIVP